MYDHEKLEIWRRSVALLDAMLKAMRAPRRGQTVVPGLRTQLLRACASIHANIAEGGGQVTAAQSARFMDIAIGSTSETQSHLVVASLTGLIAPDKTTEFKGELGEIRAMSCGFKKWLLRQPNGGA